MSPHQIIAVAARLLAIWLIVTAVMTVPDVYAQLLQLEFSRTESLVILFVVGILMLGVIWLVWRFPLSIANKLLDSRARRLAEPASPDLWLAVGCSLIGLWLITSHVPSLVQLLTMWSSDYQHSMVYLAYDLTGIALGAWLVLGARGFRKLFWWARNAGYRQPPSKGSG